MFYLAKRISVVGFLAPFVTFMCIRNVSGRPRTDGHVVIITRFPAAFDPVAVPIGSRRVPQVPPAVIFVKRYWVRFRNSVPDGRYTTRTTSVREYYLSRDSCRRARYFLIRLTVRKNVRVRFPRR